MHNEIEVEDEVIEPGLPAEEQVIRLRKANKSILSKSAERKGRIAELETENAALKTKYEASEAKYTEAVVGVPLRALAESISDVPRLWLAQFLAKYKVEANEDAKPVVMNLDGTPVMVNGEPISFSANAIWTLTTGGATDYAKNDDAKTFAVISKWQGARGSGASGNGRSGNGSMTGPAQPKKEEKKVELQFGLR